MFVCVNDPIGSSHRFQKKSPKKFKRFIFRKRLDPNVVLGTVLTTKQEAYGNHDCPACITSEGGARMQRISNAAKATTLTITGVLLGGMLATAVLASALFG